MNEEQLNTVKRRIKKLLALSKSPNENEASLAMKMANDLIAQYKFNKSDFSNYTSKVIKSTKRFVEWRAILANAVEELYATYHYKDINTGSFVFYGEELDVFMSTEMFSYLTKTVDRMSKNNIRKNAKYRFRQSYRSGVASRLYDRIAELGQECSWRNPEQLAQQKNDISLWVHNQKELVNNESKKTKANMKAWMKGGIDAEGISLHRQMTGCGNRRIGGW